MKKIAKFEKVSYEQFEKAYLDCFPDTDAEKIAEVYSGIVLPRRATVGSAGYDFRTTVDFTLEPKESIKIPTGIKAKIAEGWVLGIYPRSGLGFKFRLQLNNTVGIIDSDYYNNADNEGHIFVKITNDSKEGKAVCLKTGDAFAQGIFTEFGITEDDDADGVRESGLGSTSKK